MKNRGAALDEPLQIGLQRANQREARGKTGSGLHLTCHPEVWPLLTRQPLFARNAPPLSGPGQFRGEPHVTSRSGHLPRDTLRHGSGHDQ